jgi:hypothetical protein
MHDLSSPSATEAAALSDLMRGSKTLTFVLIDVCGTISCHCARLLADALKTKDCNLLRFGCSSYKIE